MATSGLTTFGREPFGVGQTSGPNPIAEPTVSARLLEAEGYLREAHQVLDHLQGVGQTDGKDASQHAGVIATAARISEQAAILTSRIKTLTNQIGAL